MKKKLFISILTSIFIFSCSACFADIDEDALVKVWSPASNTVADILSNTLETSTENQIEATISNAVTETNASPTDNENQVFNTNSVLVSSHSLNTTSSTIEDNPLKLTCGGAILIEQNSGDILYNHNMHEKLRPASVTKIMSLLLIMEAVDSGNISLTDKVPCTEDAAEMGGSQIWLDTTEELTVEEMLKAICVVSANDCVVAMADYLEGSQEAFVMKMNEKAKELGMNDTTFMNCHGIDENGHLTSPYDIAIMSRELLTKHPSITNYTTIYMDSLRDGKSQLVNTNKLVRNYEGCTGLKTGSTSVALYNLSASATREGLSLIAVIMKGETSQVRFSEATKLLNYGFGNYQYKELAKKDAVAGTCKISKGLESETEAVFENDYGLTMKKSDTSNIEQNVEIYNNINAPITQGQKIGEVTFKVDGKTIGTVNLVASKDIDKYGFGSMIGNVYKNWFSMLRTI